MVVGIIIKPIINTEIRDAFLKGSKLKSEIIENNEIVKRGCPSTEIKFAVFFVIIDINGFVGSVYINSR